MHTERGELKKWCSHVHCTNTSSRVQSKLILLRINNILFLPPDVTFCTCVDLANL